MPWVDVEDTVLREGAASGRSAPSELSRITLLRDVGAEEGVVPAGSSGTIAAVFDQGVGHAVEFTTPFHSVAMLPADATWP